MNPTNYIINNFSEQLNYISQDVEDQSSPSPHRFAEVHLKSNAHEQTRTRHFWILFIFTRVYRKYETWIIDGFFKRKQENNFPITQTQCVMHDYNSPGQSIWSQNLHNKSPYLLKTLVDFHFCLSRCFISDLNSVNLVLINAEIELIKASFLFFFRGACFCIRGWIDRGDLLPFLVYIDCPCFHWGK